MTDTNYYAHLRKKPMPPKELIEQIGKSAASNNRPAYIYKNINRNDPENPNKITSSPGEIIRCDKEKIIIVVMRPNGAVKTGYLVDLDKSRRTPESCYQAFLQKIIKDGEVVS